MCSLKKKLEDARESAQFISWVSLITMTFSFIMFYVFGAFSPGSPLENDEQIVLLLAIIFSCSVIPLYSWVKVWNIKSLLEELEG